MTFGETQLEIFHQRQGLLLLHFITTVMLAPSLVAWVQVGPFTFSQVLSSFLIWISRKLVLPMHAENTFSFFTSHILHVCDDKTCYWFSQSLPEIIWVPFSFLSFSGCLVYRYWNSDNKVGPLFLQRSGLDRTLPSFLDSVLTFGIILHGLYSSNADANISLIPLSQLFGPQLAQAGLSFIYAVAGLYCYFSGLALAPYRAFYALAIIGGITTSFRLRDKQARAKGEVGVSRHHFHRH